MLEREHVSFSEFQVFNKCQWKWFLDFAKGHRSKDYSVHLDFGKAIHLALEIYKNPKKTVSLEHCIVIFRKKFSKNFKEYNDLYKDRISKEEFDSFISSGEVILSNIHHCKDLSDAEVLFVEYKLYEDIARTDDIKIKFKGYVDIALKKKTKRGTLALYVCDFKTASWGWGRDKKRDDVLKMQLRLYKHFLAKKFNINSNDIRTAFIILKKKPNKAELSTEWYEFPSGNKTTMRAVENLNKSITIMNSGNYIKNRDSCVDKWKNRCIYLDTPHCKKDY